MLRRADGSSVYTVAGSDLFTSPRILAAEQRLVAAAGRTDGASVEPQRRPGAAGIRRERERMDAGQAALVRHCAPPGPAAAGDRPRRRREDHRHAHPGSGLDRSGGHVLGLAPSAAAAAVSAMRPAPRRHAGEAHLVHRPQRPARVGGTLGRSTLVIIDEAGMADTLSLDTAVQFVFGAAAVSGWSVMINNSPRSAPAACFVTSKPATARSG